MRHGGIASARRQGPHTAVARACEAIYHKSWQQTSASSIAGRGQETSCAGGWRAKLAGRLTTQAADSSSIFERACQKQAWQMELQAHQAAAARRLS